MRRLLHERLDPSLATALTEAVEPVPGALIERFLAQADPERAPSPITLGSALRSSQVAPPHAPMASVNPRSQRP